MKTINGFDQELIDLINRSECLDEREKKYWCTLLSDMNMKQKERLKEIMLKGEAEITASNNKYQRNIRELIVSIDN